MFGNVLDIKKSLDTVIDEIHSLIPDLIKEEKWQCAVLIQRHPAGTGLNVDHLLELWRSHQGSSELILISTCPSSPGAFELLSELNLPRIFLIDSRRITERLMKSTCIVLPCDAKKERRVSLQYRIALITGRLHPVRIAFGLIYFLFQYWLTGFRIYILSALLLVILLALRFCFRKRPAAG